jgi:hypothetical protein
MSDSPDLVDFQFVDEDALRIRVGVDEEVGSIDYRLTRIGVSILCCNNHKSPGRQVLEEIGIMGRNPVRSVPPGDDRMPEAVRSEVCRIVEIVVRLPSIPTTGSGGTIMSTDQSRYTSFRWSVGKFVNGSSAAPIVKPAIAKIRFDYTRAFTSHFASNGAGRSQAL